MDEYRVKLPFFEGPLDLLLHLVRKNECDIFDIPMAVITQQYLDFLEIMKELNLDVAGEYMVMAATLTKIKSALLLPRHEDEEEEGEDPRAELVRQLLEYEKFREAALEMERMPLLGRDVFARKFPSQDMEQSKSDSVYYEVSMFELMDAFRVILKSAAAQSMHVVTPDRYSIRERINQLIGILAGRESVLFESLFDEKSTKSEIISTFLAILELMKRSLVGVFQKGRFGAIHLIPRILSEEDVDSVDLSELENISSVKESEAGDPADTISDKPVEDDNES